MSALSATMGPEPFVSSPTTPVIPTPVLTCQPRLASRSETVFAVLVSWKPSSGWRWKSLRSLISSSENPRALERKFMIASTWIGLCRCTRVLPPRSFTPEVGATGPGALRASVSHSRAEECSGRDSEDRKMAPEPPTSKGPD